jgi:hypothetical protein
MYIKGNVQTFLDGHVNMMASFLLVQRINLI